MSECGPELYCPLRQHRSQTLKAAKGRKEKIKYNKETILSSSYFLNTKQHLVQRNPTLDGQMGSTNTSLLP